VSFEGSITWNKAVGIVWGPVYVNQGCRHCLRAQLHGTKLWHHLGPGYAKQSCWRRMGAGIHEPRLVASFGGWHT